MNHTENKLDRRGLMKRAVSAGVACVVPCALAKSQATDENSTESSKDTELSQVPKRKLGKTGAEISALSLGANRLTENQALLRAAIRWGVTCWDTAHSYSGGNSEICIGEFLERSPELRKQLFISTKASRARDIAGVEDCLKTSLDRMNTDYIDLFCGIHGCDDPTRLSDELRGWAEDAKKRKLIRYFGFSVHSNMAEVLTAAAKAGWIDAVLTSFNFRLMQDPEILRAVEVCNKAGVGLIAMKTTGQRTDTARADRIESEEDKKVVGHFLEKGYTEAQAAIKVVLEDSRIGSAAVGMTSVSHLMENAAAAMDRTTLSAADREALAEYARATCSGYCAGCSRICSLAVPDVPVVNEIMRHLMYYNSYGQKERARRCFAEIPAEVRGRILTADYSAAEARCPQRMPIAKLMREAVHKLA